MPPPPPPQHHPPQGSRGHESSPGETLEPNSKRQRSYDHQGLYLIICNLFLFTRWRKKLRHGVERSGSCRPFSRELPFRERRKTIDEVFFLGPSIAKFLSVDKKTFKKFLFFFSWSYKWWYIWYLMVDNVNFMLTLFSFILFYPLSAFISLQLCHLIYFLWFDSVLHCYY